MRRLLASALFSLTLATLAPAPAAAQSVQDMVIHALEEQGFTVLEVHRTWLGRLRVVALRDDLRRELVFNPSTGEILRDYAVVLVEEDPSPRPRSRNDDDDGVAATVAADPSTEPGVGTLMTAPAEATGLDAASTEIFLSDPLLTDPQE